MKRLKRWLITRFLPEWAEASLVEENKILQAQLDALRQKHSELQAYARGMERALRVGRPSIVMYGGGTHGCDGSGAVQ